MEIARLVFILGVGALTIMAVVCDVRTARLPNWLTVPAFFAGLLFHAVHGLWQPGPVGTPRGLLFALGGFATGFGILLVLWLVGGSGGGDVKLMGALGSWLGPRMTFQALVAAALFAVPCSLAIGLLKRFGLNPFSAWEAVVRARTGGKKRVTKGLTGFLGWVPHGVLAALGTWSVLILNWSGHGIAWPLSP